MFDLVFSTIFMVYSVFWQKITLIYYFGYVIKVLDKILNFYLVFGTIFMLFGEK